MRERAKERKQSTDFKETRAALLRSFKGQHGEKMICIRRVPGVIGIFAKTNSHLDPTQTGSKV